MKCESYRKEILDAALDAPAPWSDRLSAHLAVCAACRAESDAQRKRIAALDRGVRAMVNQEPSPDFALRMQQRLAERRAERQRTWFAWKPVAAGVLVAFTMFIVWLSRTPPPEKTAQNTHAPATADYNLKGESADRGPLKKFSILAPRRIRSQVSTSAVAPDVLVPPDQWKGFAALQASMRSGRIDAATLLAESSAPMSEALKPIEIAELKIRPLEFGRAETETKTAAPERQR